MAEKRRLTPFGKTVKCRLVERDCSQEWLLSQIREKTGLYMDRSLLRKILTGEKNAPIVVQAICGILDVPGAETPTKEVKK